MAFGNNLKGEQTRASFQVAGGCIMKFSHPLLAGALSDAYNTYGIDTIDVSRSVKLGETFFTATPNQDASSQVVMVDGSTVTVTNHLLNGTISIPAVQTTGIVATGDFIAACHLIIASKDAFGGTFTVIEFIDGKSIATMYYGVSIKNVPHKIKSGMEVPTYNVQLNYSGWFQAVSKSGTLNTREVWAAGSAAGISRIYKPYSININASTGNGAPINDYNLPGDSAWGASEDITKEGVAVQEITKKNYSDAFEEVPDPLKNPSNSLSSVEPDTGSGNNENENKGQNEGQNEGQNSKT